MLNANINFSDEVTKPESFVGPPGSIPGHNFIVSRRTDGSIASLYFDIKWDWTAYHAYGRPTYFDFSCWCGASHNEKQLGLIRECQYLLFVLIWYRTGSPVSITYLEQIFYLLCRIAKHCYTRRTRISQFLTNAVELAKFYEGIPSSACKHLNAILNQLVAIGPAITNVDVLGPKSRPGLLQRIRQSVGEAKQTPPIPTRIYSHVLARLRDEVTEFDLHGPTVLQLLRATLEKDAGLTRGRMLTYQNGHRFRDLMVRHGLEEFFRLRGGAADVKGLYRYISEVTLSAALLIQAYSGMRLCEVTVLRTDCLTTEHRNGKQHFIINGVTTKPTGGRPHAARWVTSNEGATAIAVASAISRFVADELNCERDESFPLFPGITPILGWRRKVSSFRGAPIPRLPRLCEVAELATRLRVPIHDEDIKELEAIDPFVDWRGRKEFAVGQQWPLKSHQFRRSLALYASRSGLVSLPSLRRQLQHITDEMASYYAKGSPFATNFIGGNVAHFGNEYLRTQPESQALSFIANVLLSDERLFGAQGTWIDRRRSDFLTKMTREDTLRRFQKGELAYRETALGGCTKTSACEQRALRWLPACLPCKSFIGKPSSLRRVIEAQRSVVGALAQDSVEWRTETADLAALEDVLVRLKD